MILLLIAALQSGLGDFAPSELRFTFMRGVPGRYAPIVGTGPAPAKWTRTTFYRIVRQCGGQGIGTDSGYNRVIVSARSTVDDFRVAECVKASTGARFNVTKPGRPYTYDRDQRPFAALWNTQVALSNSYNGDF